MHRTNSDFGFQNDLFAGKTVVITGAGRGIGLAVAQGFKACGAKIIAHTGREGTANRLDGIADLALEADFTIAKSIEDFVSEMLEATDSIDVLVNNAGTMMSRIPADTLKDGEYEQIVTLNQTAVMMVTRAAIPHLRYAEESSIINTTSISATTGGSPGSSIYSASKAFVAAYTKALARELAPDKIRANAVSPGTVLTDFHERYSSNEKLERTRESIPLHRLGTPEDCVPSYLFLASGRLSGYITGQVIEINGGQLIL